MIFTKVKLCTVLLFLLVFTEIGGQETGTNSNGSGGIFDGIIEISID